MWRGVLRRRPSVGAVWLAMAVGAGLGSARGVEVAEPGPAPEPAVPAERRIGLVFPIETRDGVAVLTAGVMINDRRVLPAGTVLYTLYQLPKADDADTKAAQHRIDRTDAFSRADHLRGMEKHTAAELALRERALKTRWPSDLPFRAMLNLNVGRDLFLVFAGANGQPEIEAVELPEGLLLFDRGQGPEVGWVMPEGGGRRAGFERGDRIVSIAGAAVANLDEFQRAYMARKSADLRDRGLKIGVHLASGGAEAVRELRAPPSLMGSILDMPPE